MYIYIPVYKNIAISEIYIIYICLTVEKRLKQGGHIPSVILLWPLLSVFCIYVFSDVDKNDTSAEKA